MGKPNLDSKRFKAVQFLRMSGYTWQELALMTDSELFDICSYEEEKMWEELR